MVAMGMVGLVALVLVQALGTMEILKIIRPVLGLRRHCLISMVVMALINGQMVVMVALVVAVLARTAVAAAVDTRVVEQEIMKVLVATKVAEAVVRTTLVPTKIINRVETLVTDMSSLINCKIYLGRGYV